MPDEDDTYTDVENFVSDSEDDEIDETHSDDDYNPSGKQRSKAAPIQVIRFLREHPQYPTHTVNICTEKKSKVPNFVGGTLPRSDQGNQEDYCMTMLTLFRPWHTGHELKKKSETWEQSFNDFGFTQRQRDIMKFFNIKYECNDARDDYSKQWKKGLYSSAHEKSMFGQFMNALDEQNNEDEATGDWTLQNVMEKLDAEWNEMGRKATNQMNMMKDIERVMISSGWMQKTQAPLAPFLGEKIA
jgi:hypothetical protein